MILQTRVQSSALSKKSTAQRKLAEKKPVGGVDHKQSTSTSSWGWKRLRPTLLRYTIRRVATKVTLGSCEKIGWELEGYNEKRSCVSELIKRKEIIHAFNRKPSQKRKTEQKYGKSLNLCKRVLQKEREHCPYSLGINQLNCSKRYLIQTFEKGELRTRLDCLRNEWNLCLRL